MDLDVRSDLATREFLGVLLAGFGSKLHPLTSENGGESSPKALLSIANKPVLDYVLSWIEESGIRDVLLICPAPHRALITHHIHSASFSSLRIDVQTYDESQDSGIGTCALLRHFSSRITDDFVVLPCDFVPPPSLPLSALLNKFRTESVSDGLIATSCWFTRSRSDAFAEEWGSPGSPVPILWDEKTGTLLQIESSDDLDHNADDLELRMDLLTKYPRVTLSTNYQDSHVYVCRRSVLDALQEKTHFHSFREEFIPWLCKIHCQRTKYAKYGRVLNPATNTPSQSMALGHSTLSSRDCTNPMLLVDNGAQSKDDGPIPSERDMSASLRVGVLVHKADTGFAARANNLQSFLEINRHFLSGVSYSPPSDPQKRSLIDQTAQISARTMIGDSTQVEERTTIKESIIGRHCVIGKMAKIIKCVILDHCVIGDGAKLDSCILGKNTKVGVKVELAKCVTQAGYEVASGEIYRNEKLDASDWTAAPEASDEGEDSDSDASGEST